MAKAELRNQPPANAAKIRVNVSPDANTITQDNGARTRTITPLGKGTSDPALASRNGRAIILLHNTSAGDTTAMAPSQHQSGFCNVRQPAHLI